MTDLKCQHCFQDNLHHVKVDVFDRGEDEKGGTHVSVKRHVNMEMKHSSLNVKINNKMEDNPSLRRHGIVVTLFCENCHNKTYLTIGQHKGKTETNLSPELSIVTEMS